MDRDVELAREPSASGHPNNQSHPAQPPSHGKFANPAPLGLLSFGTSIFLISAYGVHVQGIHTSNMLISVLIFFGGVCQFICGIMEFVAGNTVSTVSCKERLLFSSLFCRNLATSGSTPQFTATVFPAYGALNLSYAMIFLPGTGIIASYVDKQKDQISPEFFQALAMYLWAWFILTVIFTVGAMRSSWILFLNLVFLSCDLFFLAMGHMLGIEGLLKAGNGLGFVVAFLACKSSTNLTTRPFLRLNHKQIGLDVRVSGVAT